MIDYVRMHLVREGGQMGENESVQQIRGLCLIAISLSSLPPLYFSSHCQGSAMQADRFIYFFIRIISHNHSFNWSCVEPFDSLIVASDIAADKIRHTHL